MWKQNAFGLLHTEAMPNFLGNDSDRDPQDCAERQEYGSEHERHEERVRHRAFPSSLPAWRRCLRADQRNAATISSTRVSGTAAKMTGRRSRTLTLAARRPPSASFAARTLIPPRQEPQPHALEPPRAFAPLSEEKPMRHLITLNGVGVERAIRIAPLPLPGTEPSRIFSVSSSFLSMPYVAIFA